MRRLRVVWTLMLFLSVVGCGIAGASGGDWRPKPITTISVTPSLPTPSVSATPTPAPKPTVPDATDALDVSHFESAHFASPTGRIWCAMYSDWALCHFPQGMDSKRVPKPAKVCPGAGLDVTGVSVEVEADYFCSGGAEALPQTDGMYVDWWRTTGFGSAKYEGQKLAVLPYGQKLVRGRFVCLSEQSGITCGNTDSGAGFKVARAGVTIIK